LSAQRAIRQQAKQHLKTLGANAGDPSFDTEELERIGTWLILHQVMFAGWDVVMLLRKPSVGEWTHTLLDTNLQPLVQIGGLSNDEAMSKSAPTLATTAWTRGYIVNLTAVFGPRQAVSPSESALNLGL
jgi:hypothetical protein